MLASSCYCDLTIGAFNVQKFGEQKLNNADVVESLVKVNIILVLPMHKDNVCAHAGHSSI